MALRRSTLSYLDENQADDPQDSSSFEGYTSTPTFSGEEDDTPSPMGSSAPAATPAPSPAAAARTAAGTHATERPERPKVGVWRTLGALGLGFAGGYANATGKNMPQVSVPDIVENVKYGGYNRRVADWQNKQTDLDQSAQQLSDAEKLQQQQQEATSRTGLQGAQTRMYNANADQIIAGNKNPSPYTVVPSGSGVFNKRTGEFAVDPTAKAQNMPKTLEETIVRGLYAANNGQQPSLDQVEAAKKSYAALSARGAAPTRNEIALIAIGWDGQTQPSQQQATAANKLLQEGNPFAQVLAEMTQDRSDRQQSSAIETRKQNALAKMEQEYSVKTAAADPQADAWLASEKQRIQNAYQQEIDAARMPSQQPRIPPPPSGPRAVPQGAGPSAPPPPPPTRPPQVAAPPAATLPPPTDPKVMRYAQKYFNGNVQAAMAAIRQQAGGQ